MEGLSQVARRALLLSLGFAVLLSACYFGTPLVNLQLESMLAGLGLRYSFAWGSAGEADGQFVGQARQITSGANGDIYVVDASRVQRFDPSGTFVSKSMANMGSWSPQFIAVDETNSRVYVTDSAGNQVCQFGSDLALQGSWGSPGTGNGQFDAPTGIAVDATGNVYVMDSGNARVQKFDSSHTFLATWGSEGFGNGQFGLFAKGVAVDPSSGQIVVADNANRRLQFFDQAGVFQRLLDLEHPEIIYPKALVFSADGGCFVTDFFAHKFDGAGNYVGALYTVSTQCADGIALSSGKVYLMDSLGCQIQVFEPDS